MYGRGMLDEASFAAAAAELCATDHDLAAIVERHGLPEFWAREPGLPTLVLLILEQQVSLASARAAYDRLVGRLGELTTGGILRSTDEELRADGFSRQKARYVRALAAALEDGSLDLDAVATLDDAERVSRSSRCRGSVRGLPRSTSSRRSGAPTRGPWRHRAAGGRPACATLETRPTADELAAIGEGWRPHRASAARLLWHLYLSER